MHSPHEPIHDRDFMPMREQLPLRDAPADANGDLRLCCLQCGRRMAIPLADLLARHGPEAGLVNVLTANLPEGCTRAPDDPGRRPCGLHYSDLGRRLAPLPATTIEPAPQSAISADKDPPNSEKTCP